MTETRRQGEGEAEGFDDHRGLDSARCHLLSPSLIAWLAGYALLMAVVAWSLLSARQWALAELATPQSISDWQAWREDVREQQAQPGPVKRRVPNSAEPPALVLMRDYFGVSIVGAVVFTTVLYWVVAWFVRGIVAGHVEHSDHRGKNI
jgi:hypothetical protein